MNVDYIKQEDFLKTIAYHCPAHGFLEYAITIGSRYEELYYCPKCFEENVLDKFCNKADLVPIPQPKKCSEDCCD